MGSVTECESHVCDLCVQAESEDRAREAASANLRHRLKEAESRGEALAESVTELREALDRQRQAADLREEMLKQVGDICLILSCVLECLFCITTTVRTMLALG